MKNKLFNAGLILAAFLITCGAVSFGSYFRAGLAVQVGDIWIQRKVKAPGLLENKVATERNRAEAEARAENMKPILMQDPAVLPRVQENLDALFVKLDAIRYSYRQEREARLQVQAEAEAAAQAEALAQADAAVQADAAAQTDADAAWALQQQNSETGETDGIDEVEGATGTTGAAGTNTPGNENTAATENPSQGGLSGGGLANGNAAIGENGEVIIPLPGSEITGNPSGAGYGSGFGTGYGSESDLGYGSESGAGFGSELSAEFDAEPYAAFAMFGSLPVIFTETQQRDLLDLPDETYRLLTDIIYDVTAMTLEQGVQELDNKTLLAVREEFNKSPLYENAAVIGYEIVSAYLLVNVVVNEEATEQERAIIAAAYDAVFLQKDQTIVDEGDKITEEIYSLMESLGMLDTGFEYKLLPMLGVFLLVMAIFAACIMYILFFRRKRASFKKEPVLLFTLYVFVLAVTWIIGDAAYPFLPLLVFAMLVSVLIDLRLSIVLSMGMTLISYFVVDGALDYLLFFMISGTLTGLLAKFTTERNKVFMVAFVAALMNLFLSCAITLVVEKNNVINTWQSMLTTGGYAALNGLLTVIVCTGSLPLWEVLFGVVTPVKLLDLTNPTNLLLRRLTIEAPGTYHHSLIVANLAETAAYDIGANPNTARVGGYYHDIGKLKFPQYFVENLAGENPHDSMDPYNSAQLIISHVTYGLTLATEFRLPQFIRDIIQEHHGTSLIYFFYCKARTEAEANGQTVDEKDFRYPYVIPQTRESACVMLADTVEAAVRAMIPRVKSIDEVEKNIGNLIRDKLNDGQLAESGLSIKDVNTIASSFFHVLKGMYHERIPYPKMRTP